MGWRPCQWGGDPVSGVETPSVGWRPRLGSLYSDEVGWRPHQWGGDPVRAAPNLLKWGGDPISGVETPSGQIFLLQNGVETP